MESEVVFDIGHVSNVKSSRVNYLHGLNVKKLWLAWTDGAALFLLDLASRVNSSTPLPKNVKPISLSWSSAGDSNLLVAMEAASVLWWHVSLHSSFSISTATSFSLPAQEKLVAACWHPSQNTLAVVSRTNIRFFSVPLSHSSASSSSSIGTSAADNVAPFLTLESCFKSDIHCCAWSNDGSQFCIAGDGAMAVYNLNHKGNGIDISANQSIQLKQLLFGGGRIRTLGASGNNRFCAISESSLEMLTEDDFKMSDFSLALPSQAERPICETVMDVDSGTNDVEPSSESIIDLRGKVQPARGLVHSLFNLDLNLSEEEQPNVVDTLPVLAASARIDSVDDLASLMSPGLSAHINSSGLLSGKEYREYLVQQSNQFDHKTIKDLMEDTASAETVSTGTKTNSVSSSVQFEQGPLRPVTDRVATAFDSRLNTINSGSFIYLIDTDFSESKSITVLSSCHIPELLSPDLVAAEVSSGLLAISSHASATIQLFQLSENQISRESAKKLAPEKRVKGLCFANGSLYILMGTKQTRGPGLIFSSIQAESFHLELSRLSIPRKEVASEKVEILGLGQANQMESVNLKEELDSLKDQFKTELLSVSTQVSGDVERLRQSVDKRLEGIENLLRAQNAKFELLQSLLLQLARQR
eukprot:GILK01013079.1.p1 GENE.GILK01013079.1~~GILK01013079.1.p1  ORF type:complete len:659 (-),score=132.17 GILK01013079.1:171-2099(-)